MAPSIVDVRGSIYAGHMFESGCDQVPGAPVSMSAGTVQRPSAPAIDLVSTQLGVLLAERTSMLHRRPDVRARSRGHSVRDDWAPGGLACVLEAHAPGADLVTLLEGLELRDLSDAALVEGVAAWERITSLAAARQGDLIAELTARRTSSEEAEFVNDEVAARLATTRVAAENKVALAVCLDAMPEVYDALASGMIDVRKATVLTDGLAHLSAADARAVQVQVLPAAPDLTVPALRALMRRVELAIDPQAADRRHERARGERDVTVTPACDAMAWLTAFLPADDAMRAYTALDAIAASADPADPRPIGARRADALVDILGGVLDSGVGPGGPLRTQQRRRPHLHITAAATTLLGLDDAPGELAGYGPIPASLTRAIAADATWRRIFTDPATGELTAIGPRAYRPGADLAGTVMARDVTCTFPGCRIAAWRCDLDHVEPFDGSRPGAQQTTPNNVQSLCRHHHRLKTHAGWQVVRDRATGAACWTAPTAHTYRRPTVPANPVDLPVRTRLPAPDLPPF